MKKSVLFQFLTLFISLLPFHFCSAQNQTKIKMINNLPYIEATINNKGPYLFGFDTGFSGQLEIDAELAQELNLKKTGEMLVGDGSSANGVNLSTTNISSVIIANQNFKNTEAILRQNERKKMLGLENVKGIIGIGIFKNNTICLDYPNQLFSVLNEELAGANNKTIFNYNEVAGAIPQVDIKVGNTPVKALIDSRSTSGTFKIPEQIVNKLSFATKPQLVGKGRSIVSTIDINEVTINESIFIGENEYPKPVVRYPSLNEDVIIGAAFLENNKITIDCKNKRIELIKSEVKSNPTLDQYAGQYGDRTISVKGDTLFIQRPGGILLKMIEKSKDNFTLEVVPNAMLQFERNQKSEIIAINVSSGNGDWERAEKIKT